LFYDQYKQILFKLGLKGGDTTKHDKNCNL